MKENTQIHQVNLPKPWSHANFLQILWAEIASKKQLGGLKFVPFLRKHLVNHLS